MRNQYRNYTTLELMGMVALAVTEDNYEILGHRRENPWDPLITLLRDKKTGKQAYYRINLKTEKLQYIRSW